METVRSAPVRAATTTRNLFWGTGPGDHALTVTDGHWPTDMDGRVFIVGPDKRRPGGHWFDQQGLLCRIDLRPGRDGRIDVRHRRVDTPLSRIRSSKTMSIALRCNASRIPRPSATALTW